jgi:hypothetical protein
LVGFAVFNEHFVKYDNGDYHGQIATFVHEVLHALYFHPTLFNVFPNNRRGQSFLFEDNNGNVKLRGNNILRFIKDHFNCPNIDGGKNIFESIN